MMAADGMAPIHAAAQAGHIPCLTFLTSIGVSLRQQAEDGATPAHFAAASGQVREGEHKGGREEGGREEGREG